ncbi:DUF4214 domain-containing protein [Achromobacter sp. GG226]|uniref:DUF4214 domain-containing protein n=1 Tax=Verticiella alkaliphila TaxID=2779529 RepID=UPI001C0D7BCD|nr:DUF4214 domain-containing protein [Verticiella sp. GG226]MBU4609705.1 DUF4214 domain-containing protein [Verticiella sp. GG226]
MQYDQLNSGSVVTQSLTANERINDATLAAITSILNISEESQVTVGAWNGVDAVNAPVGTDPELVVITPDADSTDPISFTTLPDAVDNAPVTVFDTDRDVTATFEASVERVVVLGNGNDLITINGDANATVTSGAGNDTIITSAGDDQIILTQGDNSVETGAGADTVFGGTGYDVVNVGGAAEDWNVDIVDGQIVMTRVDDETNSLTASNVNFIQLDDGDSIAIAYASDEAETLRLYQATLGRAADHEGAKYWLEDLNDRGYSSTEIANAFLFTEEGQALAALDDDAFVAALYQNALGREGAESELAYWTDTLENGADRADVIVAIANSNEGEESIVNVKYIDGLV